MMGIRDESRNAGVVSGQPAEGPLSTVGNLRRPPHLATLQEREGFAPPPACSGLPGYVFTLTRIARLCGFLAHSSYSQARAGCIHSVPVDLSSRCEPASLIADHRSSRTGRWLTVIRNPDDGPDSCLQSLGSESLEAAYDNTCAWVNIHVGPDATIEHLCDGEREGILGVVACERTRAHPAETVPPAPAFELSRILDFTPATPPTITPDRQAL